MAEDPRHRTLRIVAAITTVLIGSNAMFGLLAACAATALWVAVAVNASFVRSAAWFGASAIGAVALFAVTYTLARPWEWDTHAGEWHMIFGTFLFVSFIGLFVGMMARFVRKLLRSRAPESP